LRKRGAGVRLSEAPAVAWIAVTEQAFNGFAGVRWPQRDGW
jgi:hypothetical protein